MKISLRTATLSWGSFAEKAKLRNSKVRYVQGDFEDPVAVSNVGRHDFVFYSGVLYHTPNPVRQLMNLHEITGELAYVSSLTIPEVPGFEHVCIYYPYLGDSARQAYAVGYGDTAAELLAIGTPFDDRPMLGHGNCWWGITRSALVSMLRSARFEVVSERHQSMAPFLTELIVKPLPIDPSLPPLSYFRERGEARARGEERWSFDTWYEDQRARMLPWRPSSGGT